MLNKIIALLFFVSIMAACNDATPDQASEQSAEEETTVATEEKADNKVYGEAFTKAEPVSYDMLTEKMQEADSMEVQFVGTVQEVCQVKGCWMTIAEQSDSEATPVMVKFKDYGFFMPKDISGRKVIMNGKAFKEVTPVEELRHYAEDAGKSQEEIEAITEPKEELKFLASGVILVEE